MTRAKPTGTPAKKSTPARGSAAATASAGPPAASAAAKPGPPRSAATVGPPDPAAKHASAPKPDPQASKPADTFVEELVKDAAGKILALLAAEKQPLAVAAIKRLLIARGASPAQAERAWARARERVRFDDHVVSDNNTYRWVETARHISPAEAVYQLARGGNATQRAQWLGVIQAALEAGVSDPDHLAEARNKIAEAERRIGSLEEELAKRAEAAPVPATVEPPVPAAPTTPAPAPPAAAPAEPAADTVHDQYDRAERRRAARERQARIDAMSTVAELAAEVEELTAKRATAEVLLEHTRALTGDRGLEAIGRAGEDSPYDETRHDPVGDVPDQGEPVIVIRPGYLWHAPGEAVLISRALVKRK